MENERFVCLGRAIYRAMEAQPDAPAFGGKDFHGPMTKALPMLLAFLQTRLVEAQKAAENSTPDIHDTRNQVVQDIRNEISWLKQAIDWFGKSDKERAVTKLDNADIRRADDALAGKK